MKDKVVKGSFNYRSSLIKSQFIQKSKAEGKSITDCINMLIENYLEGNSFEEHDITALEASAKKLKLLSSSDDINKIALKKEIEKLCTLIRLLK